MVALAGTCHSNGRGYFGEKDILCANEYAEDNQEDDLVCVRKTISIALLSIGVIYWRRRARGRDTWNVAFLNRVVDGQVSKYLNSLMNVFEGKYHGLAFSKSIQLDIIF